MNYGSTLKMRGLALAAAAGCFLATGTPAEACNGGLQPNANSTLARAMPRLLNPEAKPANEPVEPRDSHHVSIVGMWDTVFLAGGQPVDEGYEIWHSDGTEILVDISPPATDNVCIGTWTQTGSYTYKLTHLSWTFDGMGNLTGKAVFHSTVTLSHDGYTFTGAITIDSFDVAGNPSGHLEGQLQAKRIPPPQ